MNIGTGIWLYAKETYAQVFASLELKRELALTGIM